jgi:hypothetical protein
MGRLWLLGELTLLHLLVFALAATNVVVILKLHAIQTELWDLSLAMAKTRALAEWFVEEAKVQGLLPGAGGLGAKVAELMLKTWVRK